MSDPLPNSADLVQPIILQHMLAGVNAHILLDLGIVARETSPRLSALRQDFNTINAVLASQVSGVVEEIGSLSPALADVYAVLKQRQIFVINEAVRDMRDSAWRFASLLALEPSFVRPATIWVRTTKSPAQDELISTPLASTLLNTVADRESRDIVKNLRVLDDIVSAPAPIKTAL